MLKATPTWESTQNPGKLSPHSTLGQTELKGRGGWETLELKPSMPSTGCEWDPDVQACSPCGWLAKETHSSPSCWGCTANNSQRAVGEVPHHLGRPLPGEAARLWGRTGKKGPLNSAWVLACKGHGWICTLPVVSPRSHLAAWHSLLRTNGTDNEVGLWLPGYFPPASLALTVPS